MGSLNSLIRKNIRDLKPYSSARDEYEGEAAVFLDANENPYFAPLNRYPDPQQRALKKMISAMRSVDEDQIFIGNGSDEAIDILIRVFCEPGFENIVSIEPTYGMYEVTAAINGVEYRRVPLNNNFEFDQAAIRQVSDVNTKIIFLCSPNNPSGNSIDYSVIKELLGWFEGVIVIDEAYIDFSEKAGFLPWIDKTPNLVVLQTLSKAWGRAGIRLGMAFGNEEIISIMNKIKPPYNINTLTIQEAMLTLGNEKEKNNRVQEIIVNRNWLINRLLELSMVKKIYHSDANFLLVKVDNAKEMYNYLLENNIIVRNRSGLAGCDNCLRITIGTMPEIEQLLDVLKNYESRGG